MPVYVYRNLVTNETFEVKQPIAEAALTHHPETGDPVKRLIQPVGIAFKGSGFYVNDSRPGSRTSSGSSGAKESAGGGAAGDSKSSDTAKAPETAKPSESPKTAVSSAAVPP